MQEVEFKVPAEFAFAEAEALIESVCAAHGLDVAMKTSLASFPSSVHWHCKNKKEKGTLELTAFARDRRIWAQVQSGRKAPWIEIFCHGFRRTSSANSDRAAMREHAGFQFENHSACSRMAAQNRRTRQPLEKHIRNRLQWDRA